MTYLLWVLLVAALVIVALVIPVKVAASKGYGDTIGQRFGWLLFALFLTPVAWIAAFMLPRKNHRT